MVENILKTAAWIFIVYAAAPTVVTRILHIWSVSSLPVRGKVFLTFDDGPDPRYTPRVLDILKNCGVKACFFLVGEKALRHPEIVRKILADGHEIGDHGLRHRFPWLAGPVSAIREFRESRRILTDVTGRPPLAYRPPWGLLNLATFLPRLITRQKVVLWSFMSWDWTKEATPEKIKNRVSRKASGGSILIFHDSDTAPGSAAGSPEKMIAVLPDIIMDLKKKGLRLMPLGSSLQTRQSLVKTWLIRLWNIWDRVFRALLKARDVQEGGYPTFFRVSLRRYVGPRLVLSCGTVLHTGLKVCELHINNDFMIDLMENEHQSQRLAVRAVRELHRSMPALARYIQSDPRFKDVEILMGVTILHRGSSLLGFDHADIPFAMFKSIIGLYQKLILYLYHPAGSNRSYGKGDLTPKIVAISKSTLFEKYLVIPS